MVNTNLDIVKIADFLCEYTYRSEYRYSFPELEEIIRTTRDKATDSFSEDTDQFIGRLEKELYEYSIRQ